MQAIATPDQQLRLECQGDNRRERGCQKQQVSGRKQETSNESSLLPTIPQNARHTEADYRPADWVWGPEVQA